jgi:hypothetical protein
MFKLLKTLNKTLKMEEIVYLGVAAMEEGWRGERSSKIQRREASKIVPHRAFL